MYTHPYDSFDAIDHACERAADSAHATAQDVPDWIGCEAAHPVLQGLIPPRTQAGPQPA
jgi:hypothetical protein